MRLEKINSLIKEELSRILLEEFDFPQGVLVTILSVDTSPSVESVKVWVSVLPETMTGVMIRKLQERIGDVQRLLNKRVSLRFVPKITFRIDRSESYASQIDEVLKNKDTDDFN